jgi:hypothetical protein
MAPMIPDLEPEDHDAPCADARASAAMRPLVALPLKRIPELGSRLGFRPDELAGLFGVSKNLVDSWIDSGAAPLVQVPGRVRIIPAWWVTRALGGPADAAPQPTERRRIPAPAAAPSQPPVTPPRPKTVPSPATPARKARALKQPAKHPAPAAWAVPPTVTR